MNADKQDSLMKAALEWRKLAWENEDTRRMLKTTFDVFRDPKDWKKGFIGICASESEAALLAAAIIWFHGTKPYAYAKHGVISHGYACN